LRENVWYAGSDERRKRQANSQSCKPKTVEMLMPSSSKKQANFMAAIAHSPSFAKKVGVSQSVGKDFNEADKGRKFKEGGAMKENSKMDKAQDKAMVKKAVGMHDKQMHGGKKTDMAALKKGGMPMVMKDGKKVPAFAAKKGGMTKMAKGGGIESKGKTQGKMIKMNRGGRAC
jgi:hypothetical protein